MGKSLPKENNLNAYYMMGENYAKSKASKGLKKLMDFVLKQKNLKAFLCGHLHFEWQGTIGNNVPIIVAGRNFNGECYHIEFA